ncbi:MAG TPA: VCBS domain-containing protein, partial [Methanoregulaceae archaeon]|nr:VCBS domain-containing protein [Methanoregulaceae archaeon]
MSKWPSNWKLSRIDLAILLFLGCTLLVFGASANPDVTQVSLSIDNPGLVPGYNQYHVSFHVNSGLTTANGFFITFDQNTTVDDPLDPQCVNVTYNNTTLHPSWVIVIDNPDPGYTQYGFPDGTTTVKMDCPMAIPFNDDVTIDFDCGIFNDCPCICDGYYIWANTDVEKNPVKSNADYLQVEVNATSGPNGSISPSGVVAYDCCEEPMYTITPASSCYYISDVTVDNISVYGDLYFNPDGSADYYFDPLVCSHDIHATFAMEVFEVTASAGVGGTIRSPDGTLSPPDHIQQFDCGDTPCYFIKPGLSNRILDVTVDTISVVGEPGYTEYANGSALYCFDPLDADHLINATFELAPVDVFLKWRVPEEDCGYIEEVQVFGSDEIIPSVEFANALYVGGNSSEFNLLGYTSGHFFSGFDGTWNPGTAVGDQINVTGITYVEDETFTITVNLNDGSQQVFTQTISGSSDIPIVADGVKVVSVVGSGSGLTPGYQNKFDLSGTPSGTDFGDFGYSAPEVFTPGDSLGEALELDMVSPPAVNPETYIVVYNGDDASTGNMAALVILDDGTEIWAPYAPSNVVNITNMYVPSFTWNLYTEDWLDAHPEFEGLIGVKIYVNDGTYPETFEIDTPGVDMVSVNGADYTIIDAYGITPVGSGNTTAAVLISAGCVNFDGFSVSNAGSNVGGSPDEDGNGYIDASGIVVYPSSWKCNATFIDEQTYACAIGRVNVLNNIVFGSQAIGIKAIDACVLISEYNEVFDNAWNGVLVNGVKRGVECVDPPAITGGINAHSEITWNVIYGNGDFSTDRWVLNGQFTNIAVGNDYVD